MRCKKHHATDLSSGVGVCASCLRERLFCLIAAQAAQSQAIDDRRKSSTTTDPPPPHHHNHQPLVFPRSVSPYITRRKSDNTHHHHQHTLSDQRFYSTPQVGFFAGSGSGLPSNKNKYGKFSLLSRLFRSKSVKTGSDPALSDFTDHRDSCTASTSSPSWLSNLLAGHQKKQSRLFSLDESAIVGGRRICRNKDRGMSPARYSDDGEEECGGGSSGYSSESSQGWKQTPVRHGQTARRGGGGRQSHARNVSGLFCLSPLVRASPNRHRNGTAMPPELSLPGESRVPAKPHISSAASFCANRSRKLADFGRFNPNH
ncbi:hypothetical protein RJ639_009540 [Escallonia herrerae]|uniref:Uncharacterized protein n=1 Tax=Escallonia herrerae TaxID=1293975 RepID=A0AA88VQU9_9ASTE|nr:hypothetical protein RJ639_009540 [Escallonia herrerae]